MIPAEDMHIFYNFICSTILLTKLNTPPVLDNRGKLIYLELLTVWLQRFDSLTIEVKGMVNLKVKSLIT